MACVPDAPTRLCSCSFWLLTRPVSAGAASASAPAVRVGTLALINAALYPRSKLGTGATAVRNGGNAQHRAVTMRVSSRRDRTMQSHRPASIGRDPCQYVEPRRTYPPTGFAYQGQGAYEAPPYFHGPFTHQEDHVKMFWHRPTSWYQPCPP